MFGFEWGCTACQAYRQFMKILESDAASLYRVSGFVNPNGTSFSPHPWGLAACDMRPPSFIGVWHFRLQKLLVLLYILLRQCR
jgi:hypothetical protein